MELQLFDMVSASIGAVFTGLLGYFGVVRKAKSDETSIALQAWKQLIDPLTTQLSESKQEIEKLREELAKRDETHRHEVEKLVTEVDALRKELAERDEKHRLEVDRLVEQIRKLRLEVEKYKK